jgi:hypothetical protein
MHSTERTGSNWQAPRHLEIRAFVVVARKKQERYMFREGHAPLFCFAFASARKL